jgi:hypothetical protein
MDTWDVQLQYEAIDDPDTEHPSPRPWVNSTNAPFRAGRVFYDDLISLVIVTDAPFTSFPSGGQYSLWRWPRHQQWPDALRCVCGSYAPNLSHVPFAWASTADTCLSPSPSQQRPCPARTPPACCLLTVAHSSYFLLNGIYLGPQFFMVRLHLDWQFLRQASSVPDWPISGNHRSNNSIPSHFWPQLLCVTD